MNEERAERPAFGALLRRHRIAAALSQEKLAERARISVQAVSALERGARNAPRADTLALLVETLGLRGSERSEFEQIAKAAVKPRVRTEQSLGRRGETSAPSSVGAASTVPHFATQFIGRTGELRELHELVRPGVCTTLWGTGGVGKTRLAVELINERCDVALEPIAFVPLASTIGDEAVAVAVASALHLSAVPGRDLLAGIDAALSGRTGVIVLDNCEHVIGGAARIAERILGSARDIAIVCTSREPLRIGGERVFRVKALDLGDSVRLFLDRAGAASSARAPSSSERRSIETICRRLDGLPLSLELAAACTRAIDVANIERALDERFDLLTRGHRTVEARHLTLLSTIAWSYDLLEPLERVVFARVGIFNGRFTFEDAIAVSAGDGVERGEAIASLSALVDKALVMLDTTPDAAERTYRLLESTRAFATEIAAERSAAGSIDAAKRRLGAQLLVRVIDAREAFTTGDEAPTRAFDAGVLRGYLQWALAERNDVTQGTALAGHLTVYWDHLGLYGEGLRWMELGLASIVRDASDPEPEIVASIGICRLQQRLSRFAESVPHAERAYELASGSTTVRYRASAAYYLGLASAMRGEHDRAFVHIEEALAGFARAGDELGRINLRDAAALAAFRAGRAEIGRALYAEGIDAHRSAGRWRAAASNSMDLAEGEFEFGNTATAIECVREGIEALRDRNMQQLVANGLANESAYLLDAGRDDEALASAHRALRLSIDGKFEQSALLGIQAIAAAAASSNMRAERAAELYGFVSTAMAQSFPELGFTEASVRNRLEATLARRLSPHALASAEARGKSFDDETGFALALRLAEDGARGERPTSKSSDVA